MTFSLSDRPLQESESDFLNRNHFAEKIHDLFSTTEDLSIRVGIFGEWGSGKTTIANWISSWLTKDGHITIWISPWSCKTLAETWKIIAIELANNTKVCGIRIRILYQLINFIPKLRNLLDLPDPTGGVIKVAGSIALKLIDNAKRDVAIFRHFSPNKKIFIFVDDLDRCDPNIIPHFLLSLKELLDQPGLNFILMFDNEVVTRSITEHHPAWRNSDRFIEKIIDYRYSLPPIPEKTLAEVFFSNLINLCPQAPLSELTELGNILPNNPRRIKAILKILSVAAEEINRHRTDELDWPSLLYIALIRAESEEVFSAYKQKISSDVKTFIVRQISQKEEDKDLEKKELYELINNHSPADTKIRERIINLIEKWESIRDLNRIDKIFYTLNFVDIPHYFTWPEIDAIISSWNKGKPLEIILDENKNFDSQRHHQKMEELVTLLIEKYDRTLAIGANSFTLADQEAIICSAHRLLELISKIINLLQSEKLSLIVFRRLIGVAWQWFEFWGNPSDRTARKREIKLLNSLVINSGASWLAYVTAIESLDSSFGRRRKYLKNLSACLIFPLREKVCTRIINQFKVKFGVKELFKDPERKFREPEITKSMLFDVASPLWTQAEWMLSLINDASSNPIVQENFFLFLEHLSDGIEELNSPLKKLSTQFYNEKTINVLWNAAISQPLQYRQLRDARKVRAFLSKKISLDTLAYPLWLQRNLDKH